MAANTRKKDFPCIKCDNHVKKNDKAIQCSLCDLWIHKNCEKMDDTTFDVLVRQVTQNGGTFWACKSCRSYASKFDKSIKQLDRKLEDVISRVDKQADDLVKIQDDIENLKKANSTVAASANPKIIEENTKASVFNEMAERESRKFNIVVHGVDEPEPTIKDGKERLAKDLEKLQNLTSLIDVHIQLSDSIRFARRLGKINEDGKPRPLLVSFKEVAEKKLILENAKVLKENDLWKGVSLVQDLTKLQRNDEKVMRIDAEKRNAAMDEEEAKNWTFKVTGQRGQRRVVKLPLITTVQPLRTSQRLRKN